MKKSYVSVIKLIVGGIEKACNDLIRARDPYGGRAEDFEKKSGIVDALLVILEEGKIGKNDFHLILDFMENLRNNSALYQDEIERINALIDKFKN